MLKDVAEEGGPLGLCPGSHLWASPGPPDEYRRANQLQLPGHVRAAVTAGSYVFFDMRIWHTGLPLLNGEDRWNLIFTYGGPLPLPQPLPPHRDARGYKATNTLSADRPASDPHLTAKPPPSPLVAAGDSGPQQRATAAWPLGGYGGERTAPSGFCKDFLGCGQELEAMGRLKSAVRRQLFGVELATAATATGL